MPPFESEQLVQQYVGEHASLHLPRAPSSGAKVQHTVNDTSSNCECLGNSIPPFQDESPVAQHVCSHIGLNFLHGPPLGARDQNMGSN